MADTIPNIVVPPNTPVNIYDEQVIINAGITAGTQINIAMLGSGSARLVSIASLSGKPDNSTGYRNLETGEEFVNDTGDSGAWIWSGAGCTVNVKEVV